MEDEKTEGELELETLEVETQVVEANLKESKMKLSPDHFASRQRTHDIKVAKFLAGGEF